MLSRLPQLIWKRATFRQLSEWSQVRLARPTTWIARWADLGAEVHLVIACRGEKGSSDPTTDPDAGPVEDQVADLLRFSVSAEYAALRERIGVAIKTT